MRVCLLIVVERIQCLFLFFTTKVMKVMNCALSLWIYFLCLCAILDWPWQCEGSLHVTQQKLHRKNAVVFCAGWRKVWHDKMIEPNLLPQMGTNDCWEIVSMCIYSMCVQVCTVHVCLYTRVPVYQYVKTYTHEWQSYVRIATRLFVLGRNFFVTKK